uniref:Thioredoxin domain-containing protein n=1 Tax=Callorhinchus milii TaxID=7868 RepID=A0A4W3GY17_CALMI
MVVNHVWDQTQWDNLLNGGNRLVAVFFSATWCANCRMIQPHFYNLSEGLPNQHPNVVFVEVDVDESEELARGSGITCMPTFHFYKCQTKVGEFSGTKREKLDRLIMDLK